MAGDPGPMVRRRQLSALLHHYRVKSGLSAKDVAEQMFEAPSKITRIEKGQRLASVRDIADLSRIYRLPDTVRDQLMDLARGSRERQWWQVTGLSPALQTLIGMEGSAQSISQYEGAGIPGLLQTPDYADGIMRLWAPEPAKRAELVTIRMRRQEILRAHEPPDVRVVLDEAAVRRAVGGREVMREQLHHLSEVASGGKCDVRIIPFSAGAHSGLTNGFTILEFGNLTSLPDETPIPGIVFLELSDGDRYLDSADDVAYHLARFERVRRQALTTEESIELLRTAAAGL
ncbi:helix-turn-helix domain-containing protein [Actinoplanes flavus]|uniref:Helix-turn-helix domain-containing protein n=1 Tax=Actinoplanes flavus TaxID=2820290 RepID=A0ABS3UIM2_9ACTN|nr:helix-turn-helix transcriptional regulator [Actinoplanes flavus]MBO3738628.1 helix-turn-helix domain-containing protein [Actinoplanes flavus]